MKKKGLLAALLAVWIVMVDQLTKYYVVLFLKGRDALVLIKDVLEFCYLENTGAAFSLFHNKGSFITIVTILTFVVLAAFIFAYIRLLKVDKFRGERIAIIFLFGGAVGNLIDRLANGFVVDFVYFKLIDFPTFNVADCYITCAIVYFVIRIIYDLVKKKESFIDTIF